LRAGRLKAESVTLELSIYWLIQEGYRDANIKIHSDNTRVISAFSNGCSHNPACNDCICCITTSFIPASLTISLKYIASSSSLADPVSHGLVNNYKSCLNCHFLLPTPLAT